MPNNFERIKNMNVDEMAEVFEDVINGLVIAFNMILEDKSVTIKPKDAQSFKEDLKQWLLDEAGKRGKLCLIYK